MVISKPASEKKWVTISQILMLYFWLKAFSLACNGCRDEVSESLSDYAFQQDSF